MADIIQTVDGSSATEVTFNAETARAREWMIAERYGDPCTFQRPEEADAAWEFREKARRAGLKIVRK